MCHPKKCRSCGKTTWSGCGQHVAQVKAQVPVDQWCAGHPVPENDTQHSGFLNRLLGKRTARALRGPVSDEHLRFRRAQVTSPAAQTRATHA